MENKICSLHRQPKLLDLVILAVGYVGFIQQEVGGYMKSPCDADDIFIAKHVRFPAEESADQALSAADFCREVCLCYVVML